MERYRPGPDWDVARFEGDWVLIGPADEARETFPDGVPEGAILTWVEDRDYEVLIVPVLERTETDHGVQIRLPPPRPRLPRRARPAERRPQYLDRREADYEEPVIRRAAPNRGEDEIPRKIRDLPRRPEPPPVRRSNLEHPHRRPGSRPGSYIPENSPDATPSKKNWITSILNNANDRGKKSLDPVLQLIVAVPIVIVLYIVFQRPINALFRSLGHW
jgi:hypothetical protein